MLHISSRAASAARPSLCLLAALFATALPARPAHGGTLQVDPVRVEITGDRKTAAITVRNEEAVPVTIRAYPTTWTQAGGEDRYDGSSDVIVSPPVFTIAPGATQIVRVGLRNTAAIGRAYRLMIEEVPQANPSGGIAVALRLNLPLFAMLPEGSPDALSWSAWRQRDESWVVEAFNPGTGHVRVHAADAAKRTGVDADFAGCAGVVLPGSSRKCQVGQAPKLRDPSTFQRIVKAAQDGPAQLASQTR